MKEGRELACDFLDKFCCGSGERFREDLLAKIKGGHSLPEGLLEHIAAAREEGGIPAELVQTEDVRAELAQAQRIAYERALSLRVQTEGAQTESAQTEGAQLDSAQPEGFQPERLQPETVRRSV